MSWNKSSHESQPPYTVFGQHVYQPHRQVTLAETNHHPDLSAESTDPQGIDWNERIILECYLPQLMIGNFEHSSLDVYAKIRQEIKNHSVVKDLGLDEVLNQVLRERGIADTFLHVIMPDVPQRTKYILIHAGLTALEAEIGQRPPVLWLAESAVDIKTLEVCSDLGVTAVLLAPEQIRFLDTHEYTSRVPSQYDHLTHQADNQPSYIQLPNGRTIIAMAFDRPLSSAVAWKPKHNADHFRDHTFLPRASMFPEYLPPIVFTDGETYGHHAKMAEYFLNYLQVSSLPESGISVVSINQLFAIWEPDHYRPAQLVERTAWSCGCGNLARWNGPCACDGGFSGEWKTHFVKAHKDLHMAVTKLLDKEYGASWDVQVSEQFSEYLHFSGASNSEKCLPAAFASSIGGLTSCGPFFDNPQTSGTINVLFAMQTIGHLLDAGLTTQAKNLYRTYVAELSRGVDPHSNKPLNEVFSDTLGLLEGVIG